MPWALEGHVEEFLATKLAYEEPARKIRPLELPYGERYLYFKHVAFWQTDTLNGLC